jgi:hypothetical protein
MLPSEIGYIIDGSVDPKDIPSLIIYMAEKGYLSIEEEGRRNPKLIKEREIDENEKEYGDRIVERVLGLREFIQRAESDRIKQLFDQNPSYYFDILPYAMVLGVSDIWAKHFDGLSIEQPHWYRSRYRDGFRTRDFNDTLTRQFNTLNTSMSSSPSSSSSGGSSGGGSGGGGGGSW